MKYMLCRAGGTHSNINQTKETKYTHNTLFHRGLTSLLCTCRHQFVIIFMSFLFACACSFSGLTLLIGDMTGRSLPASPTGKSVGWLGFNGIFSTNKPYHAMAVAISRDYSLEAHGRPGQTSSDL